MARPWIRQSVGSRGNRPSSSLPEGVGPKLRKGAASQALPLVGVSITRADRARLSRIGSVLGHTVSELVARLVRAYLGTESAKRTEAQAVAREKAKKQARRDAKKAADVERRNQSLVRLSTVAKTVAKPNRGG